MKHSIISELFSDEELRLVWEKSDCIGRFSSWLSRVRGQSDYCCDRQEILEQESLRYGGDKVLCISRGSGRRTVWAGDCLDGLKAKLSELSSYAKLRSEERKLETMEVQQKDV